MQVRREKKSPYNNKTGMQVRRERKSPYNNKNGMQVRREKKSPYNNKTGMQVRREKFFVHIAATYKMHSPKWINSPKDG